MPSKSPPARRRRTDTDSDEDIAPTWVDILEVDFEICEAGRWRKKTDAEIAEHIRERVIRQYRSRFVATLCYLFLLCLRQ